MPVVELRNYRSSQEGYRDAAGTITLGGSSATMLGNSWPVIRTLLPIPFGSTINSFKVTLSHSVKDTSTSGNVIIKPRMTVHHGGLISGGEVTLDQAGTFTFPLNWIVGPGAVQTAVVNLPTYALQQFVAGDISTQMNFVFEATAVANILSLQLSPTGNQPIFTVDYTPPSDPVLWSQYNHLPNGNLNRGLETWASNDVYGSYAPSTLDLETSLSYSPGRSLRVTKADDSRTAWNATTSFWATAGHSYVFSGMAYIPSTMPAGALFTAQFPFHRGSSYSTYPRDTWFPFFLGPVPITSSANVFPMVAMNNAPAGSWFLVDNLRLEDSTFLSSPLPPSANPWADRDGAPVGLDGSNDQGPTLALHQLPYRVRQGSTWRKAVKRVREPDGSWRTGQPMRLEVEGWK